MLTNNITFWGLVIAAILIFSLMIYLHRIKKKTQLHKAFIFTCLTTFIWAVFLIAQIVLVPKYNLSPIIFDYVVYIGICLLPVSLLLTSIIFANTKIKFSWKYALLFVVPVISLLVLWTNDYHHLFYEYYSTNFRETVYGPYFNIHSAYSYICIIASLYFLISYAIKNSGFFSKQCILIIIGTLIPTSINILATFGILNLSIYVTPITYIITLFCYAIAMFKLQLFRATPIALQRIVDRISDSYIILNEDNIITDFNKTFLTTFNLKDTNVRNKNIFDLISSGEEKLLDEDKLKEALNEVKDSSKTVYFDKEFPSYNKYFHIEINTITSKQSFLGTLILFKDTTQHVQDMQTIKDNQDMLMEQERLSSLGQLIGGIAHNLKTPIMSIAGAAEGLTDLINEYDASIGDPEVTNEDHHAIAKDMREWIEKIHSYTAYMSDIITAVKGQAVALSENQTYEFTIDELFKRVEILMKHEIRNAKLLLKIENNTPANVALQGDVNSLVQVVNNLITNAIQASMASTNNTIELSAKASDDNVIISVTDHGCGIPKDVQEKLFKSMITTKGKNGTGLGMFMSYSTIRGHFNGDMNFETEIGKGTTFNIVLPVR